MASQNATLAFVIDRVERTYGRMTRKVKEALTSDINMWMTSTCRRWGFDFLTVDAGLSIYEEFPVDDLEDDLDTQFEQWVDVGWLVTTDEQITYPVAIPGYIDDFDVGDGTTGQWHLVEITKIHRVEQFTADGNFKKNVDFLPYRQFTRQARMQTAGTPNFVSFITRGDVSHLIFSPKPNDSYLYRVSFDIASPPPLDRPDSTNVFLLRHPDVVICAGLVLAAKYFSESDKRTEYLLELYGPEWAARANSNFAPGGLLGGIIGEDRKRSHDGDMTIEMHTTAKQSIGRGGSSFSRASGSCYTVD